MLKGGIKLAPKPVKEELNFDLALEELNEDQDEIKSGLELMGMRPFHEVMADEANITITHHEIEPTNEMIYETALELKKILTVDVSGVVIEN